MSSISTCISLAGTTTCPQWAQSIQKLKVASALPYIPYVATSAVPTINDTAAFDAAMQSLPLTVFWGQRMGCPGLATPPQDSRSYPLRFAETFTCGTTLSNVVKGSPGTSGSDCVESTKVFALPAICRETCQGFLDSFNAALGDGSVCSQSPTAAQKRDREVYAKVISNVCQGLRAATDAVPVGSSKCVESTFRDFVSCGFGNTTAGLTAATEYCKRSSDRCCSYLGQDSAAANRMVGNVYGSGARSPSGDTSAATISGTLIGGLLVVAAGGALAYFLHKRRRNDNRTIGLGLGKGGFGNSGSIGLDGTKGKIVGAKSRLSFVTRKNTLGVPIPDGPADLDDSWAPSMPARAAAASAAAGIAIRSATVKGRNNSGAKRTGSTDDANGPAGSLTRKLGPTAAVDVGQFGSGGRPKYPPQPANANPFEDPFSTIERKGTGAPMKGSASNAAPTGGADASEWGSLGRALVETPTGAELWGKLPPNPTVDKSNHQPR
ncbi:hypothetical protein HDU96_009949 [Phlyctochytrium bullatum]|nr:hypothetical protein HDU96_009949 [Phlyctochytrium bullatum]